MLQKHVKTCDFNSSALSGSAWLNHFPFQTQQVIKLQCQTRTRPALAHKVGEKLPKSPSPTSQPETTAIHHGFAPPFFTANKIQNQSPKTCCCSQYASCTWMYPSIQTHPEPTYQTIFSWAAETNDMVTSLSTISIHTFWHTASRAQGYGCWLKGVSWKKAEWIQDLHDIPFYGIQF